MLINEPQRLHASTGSGCGHTTAFTKLAKVGGKTVARSLQDDDGNIDIRKLRKNAEFRAMLDEGWPWTVMSSAVDIAFPAFAKVAQKALNVNNHVAQKTGELEMALGLVDLCSDPGFQEEPDWKGLACQSMLDQGIPAGPYARVILDFALEYGGRAQIPEFKFMHNVASQFGCSRVLGETFWTALTRTSFSDKTSLYPLLRVALALCNLSAEKTEDGIAKLLTKKRRDESCLQSEGDGGQAGREDAEQGQVYCCRLGEGSEFATFQRRGSSHAPRPDLRSNWPLVG